MPRFKDWKPPTFDERGMTRWNWMCIHPENLKIGRNVDIGAFTLIQAEEIVTLEDDVQIGGGVKIYSVNTIDGTRGRVIIKRGARVGANSVVLPGVAIGEDAIVGALSLVKTDVPAGEVWGGVPAKRIKYAKEKADSILKEQEPYEEPSWGSHARDTSGDVPHGKESPARRIK